MSGSKIPILCFLLIFTFDVHSASLPKYGGILRYATYQSCVSLDPIKVSTVAERCISGSIFDGLVKYGQGQKIIPGVASSWETSADYKTWTFRMAESAKFHNGRKVSSHDVKYSWQRSLKHADPDVLSRCGLTNISGAKEYRLGKQNEVTGIQVLDDSTLRVLLDSPDESFLTVLTAPLAWIVPKESAEKSDFNQKPVGCGPFKIGATSGENDVLVHLEAYEEYAWGRPYLDGIIFLHPSDFDSALLQFEMGEIDCLEIPNTKFGRFKGDPRLTTIPNSQAVYLKISKESFVKTKSVSDLLKYGIDVRSILEVMLYNQGNSLSADYQPEKVKPLSTSYNNKQVKVIVPDFLDDAIPIAKRIESDLEKIGMAVELSNLNQRGFQKALLDGSYSIALLLLPSPDTKLFDSDLYMPLFYQHMNILCKPGIQGIENLPPGSVIQFEDIYLFTDRP